MDDAVDASNQRRAELINQWLREHGLDYPSLIDDTVAAECGEYVQRAIGSYKVP